MNSSPWKHRIERASELQKNFPAAGELLKFYARVSTFQETVFESLQRSGRTDLTAIARRLPELYALVSNDTVTLDRSASDVLEKGVASWEEMLRTRWERNPGEP